MRILVINPGATSTKIAVFSDEKEIFKKTINHKVEDLAPFSHIIDQADYRLSLVKSEIESAGYKPSDFDAVCGRGGLLRHIASGTYEINDNVINDVYHPPYGEHASNLGVILAKSIADSAGIPSYFVDPVSVDEMYEVAHISGFKGMERESFFHALNQKGMARRAANDLGRKYEDMNMIVVHLGGGVSVAAHAKGRVVDVYNVKDDGAFGMDRAGALPVNALINFCFSGKTKAEVKKIFGSESGMFSYLGTRDFKEVEDRALSGDSEAKLIFDAFVYQITKDIGAMAAVLKYDVEVIVLTGGMAHSKKLCEDIIAATKKLAPAKIIPGEEEMRSLAEGALRVLRGEKALKY